VATGKAGFRLTHPEPDEDTIHSRILTALDIPLRHGMRVHVPNGMHSSPQAWAPMAKLGAVTGFPDLLLLRDERAGLLEVKSRKGRESRAQLDCADRLALARIPRAVVRSEDEAITAVLEWGWRLGGWSPPEFGLPKGWNTAQMAFLRARGEMMRAWRELLAVGAPTRVLRAVRIETDLEMRQYHEDTMNDDGVRTCCPNANP
jgi:hypothetical protein